MLIIKENLNRVVKNCVMDMNELENISNELLQSNTNEIDNYIDLIIKLEHLSRQETNSKYIKIFANTALAEKLVQIGDCNKSNTTLLCNILSLIGNMFRRYNLYITNEIWNFYLSCINIKGAKYYVYLFLPIFPQFKYYSSKWEFICDMPNIPPKKQSRENFYALIKHYVINKIVIPAEFKIKIINKFRVLLENDKIGGHTKSNYIQLITSLSENELNITH